MAKYTVEILDNTLQAITSLSAFVPLDTSGNVISYSRRMSQPGVAKFRLATLDKIFTRFPDLIQPWARHVRIKRDGNRVWQGIIEDIPDRNARYIEVVAKTYIAEFDKYLIRHDPVTADHIDAKTFNSGTMAAAITYVLNEFKNNATGRYAKGLTIGQIDNPNFPAGFKTGNTDLSGQPWNFSSTLSLMFDFKSAQYVIDAMSIYSKFDYELTDDLVFNFRQRLGSDKPELVFSYVDGKPGNIVDFNAPLDGKGQVNHLFGIATDSDGITLLKSDPRDQPSIDKYGMLEASAGFNDVKTLNTLNSRLAEELRLNSTPDTEIHVVLDHTAYPYGQYVIGDTVTFKIVYGALNINELRQIIGIETKVHNTGDERIVLQSNKPRTY